MRLIALAAAMTLRGVLIHERVPSMSKEGCVPLTGAVGDGVADDSAAFARSFAKTGCVVVGPGTFRVGPVSRREPLEIRGSGSAATVLKVRGSPGDATWLTSVGSTLIIRNLTLLADGGPWPHPPRTGLTEMASFIAWTGARNYARAEIDSVTFRGCPQVCIAAFELHDTLRIAHAHFGRLPITRDRSQSFAILARNDGRRTSTLRSGTVVLAFSVLDNRSDSTICAAAPSAGGIFLYAGRDATPLRATIRSNVFRCLGGSDPRHPVGAVELYAHVDSTLIARNRFEHSTYSAIKAATSSSLRVQSNVIVDSDSSVLAPAISISGCIRGPEYCTAAATDWQIDSNHVENMTGRAPAIRVGGGYAMARSSAPEVVTQDCGAKRRVDAHMVCIDAAGNVARPYNTSQVSISWNILERSPVAVDRNTPAILMSELERPVLRGNSYVGRWRSSVEVDNYP